MTPPNKKYVTMLLRWQCSKTLTIVPTQLRILAITYWLFAKNWGTWKIIYTPDYANSYHE